MFAKVIAWFHVIHLTRDMSMCVCMSAISCESCAAMPGRVRCGGTIGSHVIIAVDTHFLITLEHIYHRIMHTFYPSKNKQVYIHLAFVLSLTVFSAFFQELPFAPVAQYVFALLFDCFASHFMASLLFRNRFSSFSFFFLLSLWATLQTMKSKRARHQTKSQRYVQK